MNETTTPEFFEALYQRNPDPWNFTSSEYEQSRYEQIMHTLAGRRYLRAFEPGSSIGVLTAKLAALCGEVLAMDVSRTAVQKARQHCRYLPNVDIQVGAFPRDIPDMRFNLIVLSEIGYYLSAEELLESGRVLVSRLEADGVLLAVHWLGESPDHVLGGDRVHELLAMVGGLAPVLDEHHNGFRMSTWKRA